MFEEEKKKKKSEDYYDRYCTGIQNEDNEKRRLLEENDRSLAVMLASKEPIPATQDEKAVQQTTEFLENIVTKATAEKHQDLITSLVFQYFINKICGDVKTNLLTDLHFDKQDSNERIKHLILPAIALINLTWKYKHTSEMREFAEFVYTAAAECKFIDADEKDNYLERVDAYHASWAYRFSFASTACCCFFTNKVCQEPEFPPFDLVRKQQDKAVVTQYEQRLHGYRADRLHEAFQGGQPGIQLTQF